MCYAAFKHTKIKMLVASPLSFHLQDTLHHKLLIHINLFDFILAYFFLTFLSTINFPSLMSPASFCSFK